MADDIDPRGLRNLPDRPATVKASRTFVFSETDLDAALQDYWAQTNGRDIKSIRDFFDHAAADKLVFSQAREIPITTGGN